MATTTKLQASTCLPCHAMVFDCGYAKWLILLNPCGFLSMNASYSDWA